MAEQKNNSPKFTHLHVHSHYSLLDGLTKIDGMLDHVKELGMDSIALTDHGNMYGAVEFYQKAKQKEIKPIIGLEGYISNNDMREKRANVDDKRWHITLLAKNEAGYKNLMKLTSKAHLEGFYYKPRFDKNCLREHAEGVVALSGCLAGEVPRLIQAGKLEKAKKTIQEYKDIFEEGNYFLEVQYHENIPDQQKVNEALFKFSRELNIPLVATQDSHYTKKDDAEAHDVLLAISTGNQLDDTDRLTLKDDDFSIRSPQEMAKYFTDYPEAIENTQRIADMCNVELTLGEFIFPNFVLEKNKTANQMLDDITKQSAVEKGLGDDPEVEKRRQFELDIISNKNYSPYFLVVADIINFARKRKIYTTVRGSAAGSLIAYLSGITNVNPLEFQLPFERFLNPYRPSAPDIDMDFADNRRQEVLEYTKEKYGTENVAQICTFGTMMARGAVRDVARAMGKNYDFGDKIAKLIPMGSQGFPMTIAHAMEIEPSLKTLYESDKEAREVLNIAQKLEGTVRHASVHAAGVVISPKPLTEYTPLQKDPKGEDNLVTQYDMYTVGEDGVGLLKFDFLGIRNLAILENAVRLVKEHRNVDIDIENIPFDDKKTFEMLAKGETEGLFQLNGSGMTKYLVELKPTTIYDINAMIALYRPGPINNIPDYIARKQGRSEIKYFHPKAKNFLDKSYGILVYQDDLLFTAMELAGYNWETVDKFRKAVGKKIPKEMAKQHKIFVEGCQKHSGLSEREAEAIWQLFEPFQGYGFNKAHAACYGRVAYQTAYMKANYPVDYMCAVLTAESGDMDKMAQIMEECKRMGIKVLPPSVNESSFDFAVAKTDNEATADGGAPQDAVEVIRFGLAAIKNVGANVVTEIINERRANGPYKSLEDILQRVASRDFNKKSLESLVKSGAMDDFGERNQLLENMDNLLQYSKEHQSAKDAGQFSLFGAEAKSGQSSSLTLKSAQAADKMQTLAWEKELLGFYITSHPLQEQKHRLSGMATIKSLENLPSRYTTVKIGAIINNTKKIITKKGQPMMFIGLEDLSGKMEALVFPDLFQKKQDVLEEGRIVSVSGKISTKDADLKLLCDDIIELK